MMTREEMKTRFQLKLIKHRSDLSVYPFLFVFSAFLKSYLQQLCVFVCLQNPILYILQVK